ncbi:helix-turn-helix transcriptional regulator [Pelagicoccus sp. NFK12]|uniref:Helix-turn-helix transcriptional regulator n=1 Tax=Pelagicoccus enzymogenes TaxID=2773457 RepID=A0A927IG37_9BACT|nr:helix-turn-helix transcriptional regulator [Pelagicoccus enzymogenes]MBD5778288.1 helix-turn-helix transcriptional regulator [Pelagicoccus enzymogenes]
MNTRIMRPLNLIFPMDSDFNNAMAQRLIQLRKNEGLTQVEVAERLGISQGTYAHYERGFRRIPLERLPSLAQALSTTEEELLGLERKNGKRGPASQLERRFEAIRKLPQTRQKEILKVVDALLAQAS